MTIWRKRIARWITKAINTHPEYVILIAFPLQQWLQQRASMYVRYTFIACLVLFWPLLPSLCRCRGLLLHLIIFNETHTVDLPLDGGSDGCGDLYLTTHSNNKRQTSICAAGFEPAIPARQRPQTYALDRAATGIGYTCDRRTAIEQPLFNFVLNNGTSLATGWIYIGQTGR